MQVSYGVLGVIDDLPNFFDVLAYGLEAFFNGYKPLAHLCKTNPADSAMPALTQSDWPCVKGEAASQVNDGRFSLWWSLSSSSLCWAGGGCSSAGSFLFFLSGLFSGSASKILILKL